MKTGYVSRHCGPANQIFAGSVPPDPDFGHVARMSDSQNTFRALHTSTRGLPKDWRRRPVHVTPGFGP